MASYVVVTHAVSPSHTTELAGAVLGRSPTTVARLDGAMVTTIAAEPIDDLVRTRINADDLLGTPGP